GGGQASAGRDPGRRFHRGPRTHHRIAGQPLQRLLATRAPFDVGLQQAAFRLRQVIGQEAVKLLRGRTGNHVSHSCRVRSGRRVSSTGTEEGPKPTGKRLTECSGSPSHPRTGERGDFLTATTSRASAGTPPIHAGWRTQGPTVPVRGRNGPH